MRTFTFKGWISDVDLTRDGQRLMSEDFLWIWRRLQAGRINHIPVVVIISIDASNEPGLTPLLVRRGLDGRFVRKESEALSP